MFADSAKIFIKSGKGGDGHVSFRRELFVAAGGPDGGDGGKGGDIIFEVDEGLNTLTDFRMKRKYVAGDGEPGGKRKCHGADAKSLTLKVPEGTVIKDFETGKVIADMSGGNKREVILRGGKGGFGNMNFATATMQVPKFAKPGQPGKEMFVLLELKVIADVGLVGFPNVGKSTFINSFAGRAVTKTGNKPGVTKGKQWIRLNKQVELLDTPGILWPKFEDKITAEHLAFIGSIRDEVIEKRELAIKFVGELEENYSGLLAGYYGFDDIDKNGDDISFAMQIIEAVAEKRALIKKGGELDTDKASILLLDDFKNGRLGKITLENVGVWSDG